MNGDLGVFSIKNKQVGGFLDWEMDVPLREVSAGSTRQFTSGWQATAYRFWMLEVPDTNIMDALFYFYRKGELIPASLNKVKVNLPPDYPLNTIINSELEMNRV